MMKALFCYVSLTLFVTCTLAAQHIPFKIHVSNAGLPLHHSRVYDLDTDRLKVTFFNSWPRAKDSVVFCTKLSAVQLAGMNEYLSGLHIDTLKESYINPCVMDGFKLHINMQVNMLHKQVWVANRDVPAIAGLVQRINAMIPDDSWKIQGEASLGICNE